MEASGIIITLWDVFYNSDTDCWHGFFFLFLFNFPIRMPIACFMQKKILNPFVCRLFLNYCSIRLESLQTFTQWTWITIYANFFFIFYNSRLMTPSSFWVIQQKGWMWLAQIASWERNCIHGFPLKDARMLKIRHCT